MAALRLVGNMHTKGGRKNPAAFVVKNIRTNYSILKRVHCDATLV